MNCNGKATRYAIGCAVFLTAWLTSVMIRPSLAADDMGKPYASWKNGPDKREEFFPIAVWLQAPKNAVKYREIGIDLYVGLWNGPTEAQLAELRKARMPVVCGDRVFICTARWPETVRKREEVIPEHHVLCYSAVEGKLLWDTLVPPGPWLRNDFRSGPGGGYACPTPTTDGKLVYCAFGSSVLAALDFRGKIVWRKEIVPHTFDVTLGSSPLLYKNTLILLCSMVKPSDSKVIAMDKANGSVKWEQPLPQTGFGHSTPVLLTIGGNPQLIFAASGGGPTPQGLQSLDPTTGKRLWWCWGAGDTASPAYGNGLVYFDSGRGGPGVAVDPTGKGDVSDTHIRWQIDQVPEGIGSPLIAGDYVYRLHTPGVLKCWNSKNGRQEFCDSKRTAIRVVGRQ